MPLITSLLFLSSGLFLGWSLGANDASNVFGSAVGSRMLRFSTAAVLCSVFVILGAVIGGAGAAEGLGELGAVNALAGSFTTALAAALTVYWMTKLGLPVSTTQAVVGAIVGWNWFSGAATDTEQLARIFTTWVLCPLLAALFSAGLYLVAVRWIRRRRPHLLRLDANVRTGLILAGVFGSYSLGANNIGNVMGMFVDSSPFRDIRLFGVVEIDGVQQLFLLGSLAIAVGVFTYSRRVMTTVGGSLMTLSPVGALVVVVANALVLFVFSSQELSEAVRSVGLPAIPLIPVSSSQAVIGAVVGIGLLQGRRGIRQIRWSVLGRVASGWVTTPLLAALVGFVLLFVVQNVFGQKVYEPVSYRLSPAALERLAEQGYPAGRLGPPGPAYSSAAAFRSDLRRRVRLDRRGEAAVVATAERTPLRVEAQRLRGEAAEGLSRRQIEAVQALDGSRFEHGWQLAEALAERSPAWRASDAATQRRLAGQLRRLEKLFLLPAEQRSGP
jgi:PiT family inorganic phosphate transporter